MEKGIHEGHRQRLREKYRRFGPDVLAPHELLELILFYAIPRRDTNALAHRLLEHFNGSLTRVLTGSVDELMQVAGVGENAAVLLRMFRDVQIRMEHEKNENVRFLNTYADFGEYLRPYFKDQKREIVMYLGLDGTKKILCCRKLNEGDLHSVKISTRTLLENPVLTDAVFVVLAHNHPSGNAIPSQEDIQTTTAFAETLRRFGCLLVDHLIFAGDDHVSMAESGFIRDGLSAGYRFRDRSTNEDFAEDAFSFDL